MRRRPTWYQKNVEQPLGHKRAPVWSPSRSADGNHAEPEPVVIAPHERDDALLRRLAGVAIEVITQRLRNGDEPATVIAEVIEIVFGRMPASYGAERDPISGDTAPDQIMALIDDPAHRDRIIAAVLRVIAGEEDA
jgi:hypothetical protein